MYSVSNMQYFLAHPIKIRMLSQLSSYHSSSFLMLHLIFPDSNKFSTFRKMTYLFIYLFILLVYFFSEVYPYKYITQDNLLGYT